MNPLLFGSRERPLFGIHSQPGSNRKRRGVVICPPWGPEYQRAHRACRHLGERLTERGWDVLRFDYYGTGDSGGASNEVTLRGCVQDTLSAIEELCALADVRRVMLVGLRLGGAVAHLASAASRAVDRLVLWDPVTDGKGYLEEMGADTDANEAAHVAGFPMSPALRAEIRALEPRHMPAVATATLVVSSVEQPAHVELVSRMREGQPGAQLVVRPGPSAWAEEAALGVGAIPVEVLSHIVEWAESPVTGAESSS